MPTQLYTHGLPFIQLLRRLRADGLSLEDVPARVNAMRASGDIQMIETPRQRKMREFLPAQWWLVELPDGRLRIDTDWQSVDPIQLLYRERMPTRITRTIEQYLAAHPHVHLSELEKRGAESLALKLDSKDNVARDKHKVAYMNDYSLSENSYETRVWPAARWLAWLPEQGQAGRKRKE